MCAHIHFNMVNSKDVTQTRLDENLLCADSKNDHKKVVAHTNFSHFNRFSVQLTIFCSVKKVCSFSETLISLNILFFHVRDF